MTDKSREFSLSDFDYDLPDELIAQEPVIPRDHSRLLVYDRGSREITDDFFYNLPDYLHPRTTLVVNNTRVERCRLLFDKGSKEIFILETLDPDTVRAMVRPGRTFRKGKIIQLTGMISAEVLSVDEEGIRTLKLDPDLNNGIYDNHRHTPFPPYIKQNEQLSDKYQTVYARDNLPGGSKAAPTAGLHFTDRLLRQIERAGIGRAEVTLHVGLGTFAPVKADNIDEHHMHTEYYEIDQKAADTLNNASHITAVGTTSIRVLESCAGGSPPFKPERKGTDIFIRPGYHFGATDSLITNFHLPRSTLLMLVAAFMGFGEMHRVYRHAIDQEYRFYSFGDAMLIR